MGGTCQIEGGKIRTKDGHCVTGEECCCGGAAPVPCSFCADGTLHLQYSVTLPVMTNSACALCASDFSGQTFILSQDDPAQPCFFHYAFPSSICGYTDIYLEIDASGPAVVILGAGKGALAWLFSSVGPAPFDCNSFSCGHDDNPTAACHYDFTTVVATGL